MLVLFPVSICLLVIIFLSSAGNEQPWILMLGAGLLGATSLMNSKAASAKIHGPRVTRDTDLREIAKIEDPVYQEVKADLKRLGLNKPKQEIFKSQGPGIDTNTYRRHWLTEGDLIIYKELSTNTLERFVVKESGTYEILQNPRIKVVRVIYGKIW